MYLSGVSRIYVSADMSISQNLQHKNIQKLFSASRILQLFLRVSVEIEELNLRNSYCVQKCITNFVYMTATEIVSKQNLELTKSSRYYGDYMKEIA